MRELANYFNIQSSLSNLYGMQDSMRFYADMGVNVLQYGLRFTPYVGSAIDIYELFSGKNAFTGEELSTIERALTGAGLVVSLIPGAKAGVKAVSKARFLKFGDEVLDVTKATVSLSKRQKLLAWAKKQVGVYADEAFEGISKIDLPNLNIATNQLQKKFKHAIDFGIKGNFNPSNAKLFGEAIRKHIDDAATVVYQSTYRGKDVFVYIKDGLGVLTDTSGDFISGWKFTQEQIEYHLKNGTKLK